MQDFFLVSDHFAWASADAHFHEGVHASTLGRCEAHTGDVELPSSARTFSGRLPRCLWHRPPPKELALTCQEMLRTSDLRASIVSSDGSAEVILRGVKILGVVSCEPLSWQVARWSGPKQSLHSKTIPRLLSLAFVRLNQREGCNA